MTAIGGDGRRSIPVVGATNPSPSNALQKKQRHRSSGLKPPAQSKLSLSRGRALGTGPSRRWRWNRAGPPGPGDRIAAGGGAQKAPTPGGDDGGTGGSTGPGVQTGLVQDQSESPTAPSGRPDPARLRGNADRDETSPQSSSLETNGFAERSGLAETHTLNPRSSGLGPDRSAPPRPLAREGPRSKSRVRERPPQSLRDSSPRGGASERC
jgi:hypothetical protein